MRRFCRRIIEPKHKKEPYRSPRPMASFYRWEGGVLVPKVTQPGSVFPETVTQVVSFRRPVLLAGHVGMSLLFWF